MAGSGQDECREGPLLSFRAGLPPVFANMDAVLYRVCDESSTLKSAGHVTPGMSEVEREAFWKAETQGVYSADWSGFAGAVK